MQYLNVLARVGRKRTEPRTPPRSHQQKSLAGFLLGYREGLVIRASKDRGVVGVGMRLHVIRHFCEISSQADGMRFRRLIIIPACRTSKSRPRRLARCLPRPPQLRDRCRHLRTCHGANSSKAVPRALGTRGLAPPSTPRPRGMYRRRPRRRCRLPYLVNSSSRSASFESLHNLGVGGKVANRSVGRYFGGCGGV